MATVNEVFSKASFTAPLRKILHLGTLVTRQFAAHFLFYTGILFLLSRIKFRHRTVVLTYHRVLPKGSDSYSSNAVIVSPATFDQQLATLRQWFRPLSVLEFASHLESGRPLPSRSCLVTFDDGWQDNWSQALPLLCKHLVPAIIFIATDFVGTANCLWQERVARILDTANESTEGRALARSIALAHGVQPCASTDRVDVREYITSLKSLPPQTIAAYASALEREQRTRSTSADFQGDDSFLTWDQVQMIARSGCVTLGSHGLSHTPFTVLPRDRLENEMQQSRQEIEDRTGQSVHMLAYPNGDSDARVSDAAKRLGYRLAFTTRVGYVEAGHNPLQLPRINIHDGLTSTRSGFLCRLLGLF